MKNITLVFVASLLRRSSKE